jgi:hypothetical protein
MSIIEKLTLIQSKLSAPKGQYNSFGKYHYRSCEDILEALKPLLHEVKAAVLLSDEIVPVGDRVYVKATATLIDAENGERVTNIAYAREDEEKKGMDGAQITGACSSYARKYALNGLFAIDDNKDSDATNTHGAQTAQNAVEISPALLAEARSLGIDLTRVAAYLKKPLDELTEAELKECIATKRKALEAKGVQV